MRERLNRIELRLQYLVETGIPALIPLGDARRTLAHAVIDAMQANLFTAADGTSYAPNVYTLLVNPGRLPTWQADPQILPGMALQLQQAAGEAGVLFLNPPLFRLSTDGSLPYYDVRVDASISREEISDTAAMPVAPIDPGQADMPSRNAYLIVDGDQIFPLDQPVINIGRRMDNQLVIDDPRVSRTHAQLRANRGQYTLFDLNSTGGTYVNGQRVARYPINPGDVISLAGVALIFGQDALPSQPRIDAEDQPNHSPGTTQNIPRPKPDGSQETRQV